MKAKIIGEENLKNWKCGLIASNHRSLNDPPIIGGLMPKEIYFLAKMELFKIPGFGLLIRNLNSIPVRRGRFERETIEKVEETLRKGGSFLIFPEGSRKNFTAKPGIGMFALKTRCPILPIYIENSRNLGLGFFKIKKIKVIFGKPVDPSEYADMEDNKKNYRILSGKILERINKLHDEN